MYPPKGSPVDLTSTDLSKHVDEVLLGTGRARASSAERARRLDATMNPRGGYWVGVYRHPSAPVPLRPHLISEAAAAFMTSASRTLIRLIREVCLARAPRMRDLADALGHEFPVESLFTDNPSWTRWATSMIRPDLIVSSGRPYFTECNVNSALGGPEDMAELDAFYWHDPEFRELARSLGLWSLDTFEARRRLVAAAGRSRGTARPAVCVLGYSRDEPDEERRYARAVEDFSRHGLPCVYATPGELEHGPRGLRYGDVDIDVVLRTFTIADAHDDGVDLSALRQAVAHDTTLILAPEAAGLYGNKRIFAWLTRDATRFDAAGQRFVAEMIPWTWDLADTTAVWEGQDVDLLDLVERRREEFILKPTGRYCGRGVVAGRDMGAGRWRSALETALHDGPHVVQRFHPPDHVEQPVYLPDEDATDLRPMASVYGPLLTAGTPAGVYSRQSTDPGRRSVVTVPHGGVKNTAFFHR
jgi:hypothetical protein